MNFKEICTICSTLLVLSSCAKHQDTEPVRTLINSTFDTPNSKVKIFTIVSEGNFAIADWEHNAKAGRALAEFKNGKWQLVLCGGKAIKNSSTLTKIGVPVQTAHKLIEHLSDKESEMNADKVHRFDNFGSMIQFSKTGSHNSHQ